MTSAFTDESVRRVVERAKDDFDRPRSYQVPQIRRDRRPLSSSERPSFAVRASCTSPTCRIVILGNMPHPLLRRLVVLIRAHVLAAERIHGDDTTVPVLASPKTISGRLWTYVRDDRPFGGAAGEHVARDRRRRWRRRDT